MLSRAKVAVQDGAAPADWTTETWELAPLQAAVDAVPAAGPTYDAVVVDEAQDFTANDWELVKALAAGRPLWAFADEAQGFWEDRKIPEGLFPASLSLRQRYRCPEPLALFADQYRPRGHGAAEPPRGPFDELRIVLAPTETAIADRVANEIQKALGMAWRSYRSRARRGRSSARPRESASTTLCARTTRMLRTASSRIPS
jgi:hypothetical protein